MSKKVKFTDSSEVIPEFKQLGMHHLPGITAEVFWKVLVKLRNGEEWEQIEEEFGIQIPLKFRRLHKEPLQHWQAFGWFGDWGACGFTGVMFHPDTGFCRAIEEASDEGVCLVGPPLKTSKPEKFAEACLALLEHSCRTIGAPFGPAEWCNFIPEYVGRAQIKAAFQLGWKEEFGSLDEYLAEAYKE